MPSSVAAKTSTSPASIGVSVSRISPQRMTPVSSYSCVWTIPSSDARRPSASAGAVTGISTRHSFAGAWTLVAPRSIRGAIR